MFGKLWILLLPAAWLFIVDRERPTWRWPTFGSLVTGLASGLAIAYLALATYWVFINALLEEYVWRWFVVRQCRKLMLPLAAVLVSATGFTLHHIVATQLYFSLPLVLVAALGVFSGGVIWSWLFVRYGSIWPGYVSHVLADIAIFVIGYWLLFG